METKEKKVPVGNIKSLEVNITSPIEMNFGKIDFNNLNLYVGQNGSGKSLILKTSWICNLLGQYYAIEQQGYKGIDFEKECTFLFDHTFDANNFEGKIECVFENAEISITLNNGKCTNIIFATFKSLEQSNLPIFMSKDMRTIDNMVTYMKTKKLLGITNDIFSSDKTQLEKILQMYKIYDVMFVEQFLSKANGYRVTKELQDALDKYESRELKLTAIHVDTVACTIKDVDSVTNKITDLSTLSGGAQSLIVMILGNSVLTK